MRRFAIAVVVTLAAACGKPSASSSTTPSNTAVAITAAPITSESLVTFTKERFPAAVADQTIALDFGSPGMDATIVEELGLLGITTTTQLDAAIPADYASKGIAALKASDAPTTNIAGLLRDVMIIHDPVRYFETAWRDSWSANGPEDFPVPAAYGVDFEIMESRGVFGGMEGSDDDLEGGGGEDGGEEGGVPGGGGDPCAD